MNLPRRQQWLLALLPALLLAALDVLALRPASKARLEAATHRLQSLGAEPSARDGSAASAESLSRAREESRELEQRAKALPSRWAHPDELAQTARELSAAFQSEGLTVRSARLESEEAAPKVAPALHALKQTLRDLGAGEPHLWRLDLSGRYEGIVRALEAFPGVTALGLPITLAAALGHGSSLDFTLWFWI